jgi:hypothetical protein
MAASCFLDVSIWDGRLSGLALVSVVILLSERSSKQYGPFETYSVLGPLRLLYRRFDYCLHELSFRVYGRKSAAAAAVAECTSFQQTHNAQVLGQLRAC